MLQLELAQLPRASLAVDFLLYKCGGLFLLLRVSLRV